jgi:hypothetical protein
LGEDEIEDKLTQYRAEVAAKHEAQRAQHAAAHTDDK